MAEHTPVILETLRFLRQRFSSSDAMTASQRDYRLRHTLRVAALGREIARAEGLHEDALVVGCLLHDLAYAEPIEDQKAWLDHGRRSAALARPFVETLDLPDPLKEELLYGIAIHVDDEADFAGERTVFALTIGDCDNIDRFDAYRIYENLEYAHFSSMTEAEQHAFLADKRARLEKHRSMPLATETATRLWQERIDYQIGFYDRMIAQFAAERSFSIDSEASDHE